jgi:hypothetical protein
VQIASEKGDSRTPLKPKESESVLKVLNAAVRREPDNAYWHQMRAVFLNRQGRVAEARTAWIRATKSSAWNDHQTSRLNQAGTALQAQFGAAMAWQQGFVYYARSDAPVRGIDRFARSLLSRADFDSPRGLSIRYSTILNGNLLRLGSRSIREGRVGADMVDLAAYPPEMTGVRNPKRLYLGRNRLINALKALDRQSDAITAHRAFHETDAWRAMSEREDAEENVRWLSVQALAVAFVPGLTLLLSVLGVAVWGAGNMVDRITGSQVRLSPAPALMCASALAVLVFLITWFPLAAAASALSFLFLTVGPKQGRKVRTQDLGPLFTFTVLMVGLAFSVAAGLYLAGTTTPALGLLPLVSAPTEFYGSSSIFAGLAVIVFGVLFLVAPLWALVQRLGTPYVLGLALRKMGSILGIGGLFLTVALAPIMIYLDRQLSQTLGQLVGNEPVYYLLNEP